MRLSPRFAATVDFGNFALTQDPGASTREPNAFAPIEVHAHPVVDGYLVEDLVSNVGA